MRKINYTLAEIAFIKDNCLEITTEEGNSYCHLPQWFKINNDTSVDEYIDDTWPTDLKDALSGIQEKITIKRIQLKSIFQDWNETEITQRINIKKEQIINIQVVDGAVYLFYWIAEKINNNIR